jgi:hypothetical protein
MAAWQGNRKRIESEISRPLSDTSHTPLRNRT